MATISTNASNVRTSVETTRENLTIGPLPHPPREVWPLLLTIAATELAMAAVILWFSAPTVAPVALTGLGIGVVTVAAITFTLRLIVRMTASRTTIHAGSHHM